MKVYWYTNASFGQIAAGQMEPAAYTGNTQVIGTGLIDAHQLLKAVEGRGVEMTVPNMYVSVGGTSKINYSVILDGENMTFSCKVDDSSIAVFLTAEDNITFTLKGLKVGSTKATVTATKVTV